MKQLIIISIFAALAFTTSAGESTIKDFEVAGFRVLLKQNPKDVISVRLFVEGGTANYLKSQEGIEAMALNMAINGGTESMDKIEFATAAEKIGTSFESSTSYDYGQIAMTCIKPFWNESWQLFTDAILNPRFDADEFNLMQEQAVATAKSTESDPDAHLRNLAMENVFEGRNYAKNPDGTPESLANLRVEATKAYFDKTISKKRCFLVVVGNISQEDLTEKINASLAKLEMGKEANFEPYYTITQPAVYKENRDIATNYIRGLMSAPRMSHDDGVPMRVSMSILYDRFFEELRTKRSLSYAPAAFYSSSVINNPYNAIYISTLDPKQSMEVMTEEINKIKANGFDEKELINKKQTFLTQYYMGQETNGSQSMSIGLATVAGSPDIFEKLTERVNALSLKDINRVFDTYTNAIQWTYLGKTDQVKEEDFRQTKEVEENRKPY